MATPMNVDATITLDDTHLQVHHVQAYVGKPNEGGPPLVLLDLVVTAWNSPPDAERKMVRLLVEEDGLDAIVEVIGQAKGLLGARRGDDGAEPAAADA